MLIGILDAEGSEDGHHHEEVVHGEGFLKQIAGDEQLHLRGAFVPADVAGEGEGEGDPHCGPDGGVAGGDGFVVVVGTKVKPHAGDDQYGKDAHFNERVSEHVYPPEFSIFAGRHKKDLPATFIAARSHSSDGLTAMPEADAPCC